MFIADIDNPFRAFLSACGAPQHNINVIPKTSRESLLGSCSFLDNEWRRFNELPKYTSRPLLFIISLDGMASKEMYSLWENNHLTDKVNLLIPDYILKCDKPVILFDNSAEGHCDEYIFKMISQIVDYFKLDPATTFYGNSAVNIKNIHASSNYNNFKTIYTNNYKEDTISELYDQVGTIEHPAAKKYLYNCLNNAPRPHRALLLGGLIKRGLDVNGLISSPTVLFNELYGETISELGRELTRNYITVKDFNLGTDYLNALSEKYPLILDSPSDDQVHMKNFSDSEDFISDILSCDIQIVTETFTDYTVYITEKIFKPIILRQPFMVLGSCRTLHTLREQGYHTFDHLYTDITVYDKENNIISSVNMLLDSLETLLMKKDSPACWDEIEEKNIASATHNYRNFISRKENTLAQSKRSFNEWLDIYSDYNDVFTCYN